MEGKQLVTSERRTIGVKTTETLKGYEAKKKRDENRERTWGRQDDHGDRRQATQPNNDKSLLSIHFHSGSKVTEEGTTCSSFMCSEVLIMAFPCMRKC